MRNSDFSETALIKTARESLETRLPSGWQLSLADTEQFRLSPRVVADAVLQLKDPEGRSALVILEAKRRPIEAREVSAIADSLRRMIPAQTPLLTNSETSINLMVVSPFLGPSAKDRLTGEEISFADLTGNLRFVLRCPAVFIEVQGATKNPWRENVPLRSLRGRGASRVVRGFLDYQPPFGIRELAAVSKSPVATTSRVADLLERETIIERESPRGQVLSVDWEQLLRRWAQDYNFIQANNMQTWLEPRGTRPLLDKLRQVRFKYAITGSVAGVRYAPIAEPRLIALYLEELDVATEFLGLRPAETGGNVLLGVPFDPVVFDRTVSFEDRTYVSVTQVAIDLLTGPGRNPAEAESLIEWMKRNQDQWQISLSLNT
jgi:hypothetical protein